MFEEIVYEIYYRLYYFLVAIWIIKYPKVIKPPKRYFWCISSIDSEAKRHSSFLYIRVDKTFGDKWLFWKRKFAFRISGHANWYQLPSLTPWDTQEGSTKLGLNSTFVKKWQKEKLEFITWM